MSTPFVATAPFDERRDFNGGGDTSLPGTYYLGLSLAKSDLSYEYGYNVVLEIVGDARPLQSPTPTQDPIAAADPTEQPTGDGTSWGSALWIGLGAVVVIGGGALVMVRRMRE